MECLYIKDMHKEGMNLELLQNDAIDMKYESIGQTKKGNQIEGIS